MRILRGRGIGNDIPVPTCFFRNKQSGISPFISVGIHFARGTLSHPDAYCGLQIFFAYPDTQGSCIGQHAISNIRCSRQISINEQGEEFFATPAATRVVFPKTMGKRVGKLN